MTTPRKTLGELLRGKEGPELELKSSAVIDDELILPRAVCSLLNAGGGTVLVGVRDDGSIEGVADAVTAKRRVEELLARSIAPDSGAMVVVEEHVTQRRTLLRIDVPERGAGTLHAVQSTKGRFLVPVRAGNRTVALSWLDVLERLGHTGRAAPERSSAGPGAEA